MTPVSRSLHLSCVSLPNPVITPRRAACIPTVAVARPQRRAVVTQAPAPSATPHAGLAAPQGVRHAAVAAQTVRTDPQSVPTAAPVALITGATSDGIGARVMEGLLKKGFDIVAVARSEERAERLRTLAAAYPVRRVHIYYADLALKHDIRRVAQQIQASHPCIDRMVNSLGVMLPQAETTSENMSRGEMVNALAPWMLARLLMPALLRSQNPRIVQLNSDGHASFSEHAPLMFRLYGAEKLTALQLNYELARRLKADNLPVRVNSVHPGYVKTELGRHMDKAGPWWQRPMWIAGRWLHTRTADTPEKAAAPIVALASDDKYKDQTGAYFDGARKTASSPASVDRAAADEAWNKYSDLVGLPRDALS